MKKATARSESEREGGNTDPGGQERDTSYHSSHYITLNQGLRLLNPSRRKIFTSILYLDLEFSIVA